MFGFHEKINHLHFLVSIPTVNSSDHKAVGEASRETYQVLTEYHCTKKN